MDDFFLELPWAGTTWETKHARNSDYFLTDNNAVKYVIFLNILYGAYRNAVCFLFRKYGSLRVTYVQGFHLQRLKNANFFLIFLK